MDDHAEETSAPGPQGQDGKDATKSRRFKKIYTTGLYLALLAAGVFLADQVHVWWMLRQQANPQLGALSGAGTNGWRSSQSASQDSGGLQGILPLNDQMAGLAHLDGNPGDLPPPPGAVRRWSFQRSSGGMEQYARYDFSGSVKQAGDFYLRVLKDKGYHLVSDQSQDAAKRLLVFASPLAKVVEINLHKSHQPADSVDIGLRVSQAGSKSAGNGAAWGAGGGVGLGSGPSTTGP